MRYENQLGKQTLGETVDQVPEGPTVINKTHSKHKTQRKGLSFHLTPQMIEEYVLYINEKELKKGTISFYISILKNFYEDLPEGKRVETDTISDWNMKLLEKGFAVRTVNARISAVNAALEFWGYRDLQFKDFISTESTSTPAITKSEYIRLLQMARLKGKEQIYLIIKLLALTGVRSQDFLILTLEQVQDGYAETTIGGVVEKRYIPHCLREELLEIHNDWRENSSYRFLLQNHANSIE